ncbi:MAG TPA: DNA repair protein RecO [Gammaproteobacteria bacterium]|nr:DNA repair protein RecO [Gammaproteobacteria bacterium]
MRNTERILLAPAYVLHQRDWQESSRIIEILSRDHGRLGLVARGARRPASPLRALLVPFQPLLLSWNLRGELGTLTQAEPAGVAVRLGGQGLLAGFYLNELLLNFAPRHDPQPEIYAHYAHTLPVIADPLRLEAGLRLFELRLLETAGYGLNLERDAQNGRQIEPGMRYRYDLERGPVRAVDAESGALVVGGATLLGLASGELHDAEVLREARRLLRAALDRQLGGRVLKTREVLRKLVRAGSA